MSQRAAHASGGACRARAPHHRPSGAARPQRSHRASEARAALEPNRRARRENTTPHRAVPRARIAAAAGTAQRATPRATPAPRRPRPHRPRERGYAGHERPRHTCAVQRRRAVRRLGRAPTAMGLRGGYGVVTSPRPGGYHTCTPPPPRQKVHADAPRQPMRAWRHETIVQARGPARSGVAAYSQAPSTDPSALQPRGPPTPPRDETTHRGWRHRACVATPPLGASTRRSTGNAALARP